MGTKHCPHQPNRHMGILPGTWVSFAFERTSAWNWFCVAERRAVLRWLAFLMCFRTSLANPCTSRNAPLRTSIVGKWPSPAALISSEAS